MRSTIRVATTTALAIGMAAGMASVAGASGVTSLGAPDGARTLTILQRGPGTGLDEVKAISLAAPVADTIDTVHGNGTWVSAADGGVFAFGSAKFYGSLPGLGIKPVGQIVSITATPHDHGYWLLGSDGGVVGFGLGVTCRAAAHTG